MRAKTVFRRPRQSFSRFFLIINLLTRVFGRLPSDVLNGWTHSGARVALVQFTRALYKYSRLSEHCAVHYAGRDEMRRWSGVTAWEVTPARILDTPLHKQLLLSPLLSSYAPKQATLFRTCSAYAWTPLESAFSIFEYVRNCGRDKTQCKTIVRGSLTAIGCSFHDIFERVVNTFLSQGWKCLYNF